MTASRTQFMNYLSLCFLPNKCFVPHPRTTASGGRVFQVPAAAGWCPEATNSDQLIRDGCCSTQKSIRNGFQIERQEKVLLKWGRSAATSTHQSNPLPVLGLGGGCLSVDWVLYSSRALYRAKLALKTRRICLSDCVI